MKFRIPWRWADNASSAEEDAVRWIVRKETNLSKRESNELHDRITMDPEFAEEYESSSRIWDALDNIPPEVAHKVLEDDESKSIFSIPVWSVLGTAAAIVIIGFAVFLKNTMQDEPVNDLFYTETSSTLEPWTQRLPDGSVIRLNAGSKIKVNYSPEVRSVDLLLGEAHFMVARQLERPFVVLVNHVRVQAVGTAFNVKFDSDKVDVWVTEGTVTVVAEDQNEIASGETDVASRIGFEKQGPSFIRSGQRAEILITPEGRTFDFVVFDAASLELEQSLDWQKSLLMLGGASLHEIASTFEQKTGVKLIIADRELGGLEIGGQFPSQDVKGFLDILKSGYGIEWSERRDGTLVIGESL